MPETAWFTYDDFADRVGEQFRIDLGDGQELTLVLAGATVGAEAGGAGPDGSTRQQFSLLFRGPAEPMLDQAIWTLQHDEVDGLALFLVPLAPDAEGARYEAAFA
ncbi:DUF6916 family protein [Nocardioides pelophilus]|uniref:DUF6916 family protein n=1 Tax=Nocardioides pelophilus TaxID=2172019 RepID=UPI00160499CE|nr:hypothetical protein [Nocardioides pelophilus]